MSLVSTHVLRLFCLLSCLLVAPAFAAGPGRLALVPCRGREQRHPRGGDPRRQPRRIRPDGDGHAAARPECAAGSRDDADQDVPAEGDRSPDRAGGPGVSRAERRRLGNGLGRSGPAHRRPRTSWWNGRCTSRMARVAVRHNASGVTATAQRWILAEGASGMFSTFILVANPNPTTVRCARPVPQEHGRHRHLRADAAGQQPDDLLAAGRIPGAARIGGVLHRRREYRGRQADRRRAGDVLRPLANRQRLSAQRTRCPWRARGQRRLVLRRGLHRRQRADGVRDLPAACQHQWRRNDGDRDVPVRLGPDGEARLRAGAQSAQDHLGGRRRPHVRPAAEGVRVRHDGEVDGSQSSPSAPCTGAHRRPRTRAHRRSRGGRAMPQPGRPCWHPGGPLPKDAKARMRSVRPYSTFFLLSNPSPRR